MYGSQKSHYHWLKCHKKEEKIDSDYVLRNNHRIKPTQSISMILVSFFSEDNVLFDENQSNKNLAFRFWGDNPVYGCFIEKCFA